MVHLKILPLYKVNVFMITIQEWPDFTHRMVIIDELKESNNPGGKSHTKWQFKLPFILVILWSFKLTENGQPFGHLMATLVEWQLFGHPYYHSDSQFDWALVSGVKWLPLFSSLLPTEMAVQSKMDGNRYSHYLNPRLCNNQYCHHPLNGSHQSMDQNAIQHD